MFFLFILCLTANLLAEPPRRFVFEDAKFLGTDTIILSGYGEKLVAEKYQRDVNLAYGCIAITFGPNETLVRSGCQIDPYLDRFAGGVYDLPGTKLEFLIGDKENIGAALAALKKCSEWGTIAAKNKVDIDKHAGDFVYRDARIGITFSAVDNGKNWRALLVDDAHHLTLKPIFDNEVSNLFYLFENMDKLASTMKAQLQEHNQAVSTKKNQTEELFK